VTFTQLRAFALVAELGSLRAAAVALGVSEPAVSAAVAALRADLGDALFVRSGSGISLTPGGRALAGHARELVRLADRARREVRQATSAGGLRALATAACAEHAAATLVDAFTGRAPGRTVHVTVGSTDCAAAALAEDVADIALGVRPVPPPGQALESVPFLRYQRVLVAAPGHPLAVRAGVRLNELAGFTWLAGPAGIEPGTEDERWSTAAGAVPPVVRMDSEAEALAAVRAGNGLFLALAHLVGADLRRGTLVRLPVEGTPVTGIWWATVPGHGRATSTARALQRFLTTPDAMTALLARPPRPDRPRPTVRVELWS
jgi:LysR family transcriptional regulator, low CO2-responsive transcriptional regulator